MLNLRKKFGILNNNYFLCVKFTHIITNENGKEDFILAKYP